MIQNELQYAITQIQLLNFKEGLGSNTRKLERSKATAEDLIWGQIERQGLMSVITEMEEDIEAYESTIYKERTCA